MSIEPDSESGGTQAVRRLEVGYYLDNFELALKTVLRRDADLFDPDEKNRLSAFETTDLSGRRLLVRLFARRSGWHRVSMLKYEEIPDCEKICNLLSQSGLLEPFLGDSVALSEVVLSLRMSECQLLLNEAGVSARGKLVELQKQVCDAIDANRIKEIDSFIQLADRQLYRRVFLLFFANRRQDLSDFIVRDIGNLQYEEYRLSDQHLFSRRQQAIDSLQWADWRDDIFAQRDQGSDTALSNASLAALDLLETTTFTDCSHRGKRLLTSPLVVLVQEGIALLERRGNHEDAICMLERLLECDVSSADRGHATQRLLIDLAKTGRPAFALRIAEKAVSGTSDPVLLHDLNKRRYRLSRRMKLHVQPPHPLLTPVERRFEAVRMATPLGKRNRFLDMDGTECDVETMAIKYYERNGEYRGVHVENNLPAALVATCFWDIIFMDIDGAFLHEFQSGPLDWGEPAFYLNRVNMIQQRLSEIREEQHLDRCLDTLKVKAGIVNPLFSWNHISTDTVKQTLLGWPGKSLADCLEPVIQDTGSWKRGFPDLVLFSPTGEFHVSEVKGPGDKVSPAQSMWFDLLLRNGVSVELCNLNEKQT